jgi:hypothetical protein
MLGEGALGSRGQQAGWDPEPVRPLYGRQKSLSSAVSSVSLAQPVVTILTELPGKEGNL